MDDIERLGRLVAETGAAIGASLGIEPRPAA
jgi:hypothetical protein